MADRVSLLDELRSGRYEASIATTFSIHFPFYEMVVHRKLLRSGCLVQMVLVDSAQCAAALAASELRPQLAGSSYVLVPVSATGAFHPKIQLLLGKKGGKLLLGSHNLTFGGFGGNAEVTNLIAIEPRDRASVAIARAAFDAIRTWVGEQPAVIEEYLKTAEERAPWLRGPMPTDAHDLLLWSAPGKTQCLWDQLRPHLRGPYSRVTVLGPFFDTELAFIHRLLDELQPAELIVGVDPRCSQISVSRAKALKNVRFVDARGVLALIADREETDDTEGPPLHAKMLWIEGRDRTVLVTGSANPSRPAWLDTDRNAEAVLVRIDPEEGVVDNLALHQLVDSPILSELDWALVNARAKEEWNRATASTGVAVAMAEGSTIVIRGIHSSVTIDSLSVHTQGGGLFPNQPWSRTNDGLTVTAPPEVVEAAALVEIRGPDGYFAVVHHRLRLHPQGGRTSLQKDLRTALGAMTDDPSQLVNVIQIIQNAIFDEDGVRFRKGELRAEPSKAESPATPLGSLAIGLDDVKRRRGRRKSIADRDLATVLDLLVHRLGQDLADEAPALPPEVEERYLEGVEPEKEPPGDPPPVDSRAVLRACQRKVKKVLTQMSRRLDLLDGSSEAAASAVARLAAVVGTLRWLRRLDLTLPWLPFGESVIPADARAEFFWEVAGHFATSDRSPIAVARTDLGDEPWQEASLALGSLGWLGWECEIDRRTLKPHPDEEERSDYGWVSRLGWVMREVVLEEGALEILRETMTLVRRGRTDSAEWLREHESWAEAMALLEFDPKSAPTSSRAVQRGDLVRLDMPDGRCQVAYVLSLDDRKLFVADPGRDNGRPVMRQFATVLDWARLVATPALTAAS